MDNIRMVVTDLDDTLLPPDKAISQAAVDAVAALARRGIPFTFITGRPPYAVERYAARANITSPMVCCNGAMLCDRQGQVLRRRAFPLAPLRPLLEEAAGLGLTVLLYTGDVEYTLKPTPWTRQRALPRITLSPEEWAQGTADKANLIAGRDTAAFARLIPQIQALSGCYSIALYGDAGCEFVAGGVNKATGLTDLCALHGIQPGQVLAVGDNENDIDMLRAAGIGAAVANAVDSAKAAADYLCRESYTDGVLEAVHKYVLEVAPV